MDTITAAIRIQALCNAPHWNGEHVSRRDRIEELARIIQENENKKETEEKENKKLQS
jgi:hypothetical protein